MPDALGLKLDYPISANRYWRRGRGGRIYTPPEALEYKQGVADMCAFYGVKPFDGKVSITVHCFTPSTRADLGNASKVLEDSLQGFFYHDDIQIAEQHYYRYEAKAPKRENACVYVCVEPISPETIDIRTRVTRRAIGLFEAALIEVSQSTDKHPILLQAQRESIASMLKELREQLNRYEQ